MGLEEASLAPSARPSTRIVALISAGLVEEAIAWTARSTCLCATDEPGARLACSVLRSLAMA